MYVFSFCEECRCLISSTGIHAKTCSKTKLETTFEGSEELFENGNSSSGRTPEQVDQSSDFDEDQDQNKIPKLQVKICDICNGSFFGSRELEKHKARYHYNKINENYLDDESEEFDEGEEGIDTSKTSEVKRRKKGSRKRRRFRITAEQKKILLAAYDKLEEDVVDKVHIIEELGSKLNLPRNKIEVSK